MEKTISFTAYLTVCLLWLCSITASGQKNDIAWLRSIHVNRNTSLDGIMMGASQSTYPIGFALPAGTLLYGYIAHDKRFIANGWQSAAAIGTSMVITYALKYSIQRKRPYETYGDIIPYDHTTTPSFPSGHTSLAFTTATTVSLQYRKWYIVAPAYAWAGLVGYSRMHLGMHYPTDVAAGAIVGAGAAVLAYKGQQWMQKRKQHKATKTVE